MGEKKTKREEGDKGGLDGGGGALLFRKYECSTYVGGSEQYKFGGILTVGGGQS